MVGSYQVAVRVDDLVEAYRLAGGAAGLEALVVCLPESVDRTPSPRVVQPRRRGLPTVRQVADEDARTTVAEDLALMQSAQGGRSSRGYRPGPW